jgi:ribonuclease T2
MTRTTCTLALTAALFGCSTTAPRATEEIRNPTQASDAGVPPGPAPAATGVPAEAPARGPAPGPSATGEAGELAMAAKKQPDAKVTGGPGEKATFGLYMLALTWAPNFCATHKDKEQCKSMPGSFAADHLTIHGLWPNYSDKEAVGQPHAWPEFCSPYNVCSTASPSSCNPDPASIPPEMKTYGPGYLTDDDFLANHEWPKHGSCTGLAANAYFSEAIKSLLALPGDRGTPGKLASSLGKKVKATELRSAFEHPESVVLSCDAKCNLSQVGICLANGSDGLPAGRVACPKNVISAEYDNGCFVKNRCKTIKIQAAPAAPKPTPTPTPDPTPTPTPTPSPGATCKNPGQGPACEADASCKKAGFLRCAKSGCCTNVPK